GKAQVVDCVFDFLGSMGKAFESRTTLKLHHLSSEGLVTVHITGGKGGKGAYGRMYLKEPALLLRGDRFILRDPSIRKTVGGGRVLLPHFSKRPSFRARDIKPGSLDRDEDALGRLLEGPRIAIEKSRACLMMNMTEDGLRAVAGAGVSFMGEYIVNSKKLDTLTKELLAVLSEHHKNYPGDTGVKEEALKGRSEVAPGFMKTVVDRLVEEGVIKREGSCLSLASHRASSSGEEAEIEEGILGAVGDGVEGVPASGLRELRFKREDTDRVLGYLIRRAAVIRLREGRVVSAGAVERARKKLVEYLGENDKIKAAEFRDVLGCGRKAAIDMLEYFDRERVTIRVGDERTLRGGR
ncbi:MAG: SelB C-terminal domain-containing protein, partial [Thermodesulfobacteriota bacterium]